MRHVLAVALGLLFAVSAMAQELPPEQQARYRSLINELRCLVCQNQTIADSSAPLAADLREQVRSRVVAGESDEAIRGYVTDRYGEFVLYKPRLSMRTALLWCGPFLLAVFGSAFALLYMRASRRTATAPPSVDQAALQRLLDEER